ncbi:hypothetical protein K6W37_17220 [Acetobacter senegalensis]|nr:hypothetical protein [Acetobacter senegalensis]
MSARSRSLSDPASEPDLRLTLWRVVGIRNKLAAKARTRSSSTLAARRMRGNG